MFVLTPRMRRAFALLILALTAVHPAVHGDAPRAWTGPSLSSASSSVDCPCVRAALITTDPPDEPGRVVPCWTLETVVDAHVIASAPLSIASRAPPAA